MELDVYLGGTQDIEHKGQACGDQLLAVVLFSDCGELSEEGEGNSCPGLLLGTTQRFKPHMQFPRYTWIERRIYTLVRTINRKQKKKHWVEENSKKSDRYP